MFRLIRLATVLSILVGVASNTLAQDKTERSDKTEKSDKEKKSDKEELEWKDYSEKEFDKKRFSAPTVLAIMRDL